MKNILRTVLLLTLLGALLTGCAVNRATATVDPGVRLENYKTMHVVKGEDGDRNINVLIADKLRSRGFAVTTDTPAPTDVHALVTYVDKWMWDITMYMIELTITIRDPKTEYPLASGNSFHTSLTRLSPPEMVNEVVENILKEGKSK